MLQVVLIAVQHLSVVLEVHAATSLWTSRIPRMRGLSSTGSSDADDAETESEETVRKGALDSIIRGSLLEGVCVLQHMEQVHA